MIKDIFKNIEKRARGSSILREPKFTENDYILKL